jgi:hypothetical protein
MFNCFVLWSLFGVFAQLAHATSGNGVCTIIPKGNGRDDSAQLLDAVKSKNCTEITLPQPYSYSIQKRLLTDISKKTLNVFGTLQVRAAL